MPPTPLRPDDPERIDRFTLAARLGFGGMGVVYLASDDTGRPLALKVIRADLAAEAEFRTRFRREIAAARAVKGARTARLVDADPDADDPWMATEHITGPSLAEAIAADGALPTGMVVALAIGLAEALTAIHRAGIVHRDLKPGNVILGADGPKVIDFGIAAAADAMSATGTGVRLGSPGYMAPEQVTGRARIGPAADVFAWGLTVLFASTGRPPFGTGHPDALLYRVVHDVADLSDVPSGLRPAVAAALAKEPAARPDAAALLGRLVDADGDADGDPDGVARQMPRAAWPRRAENDAGLAEGDHVDTTLRDPSLHDDRRPWAPVAATLPRRGGRPPGAERHPRGRAGWAALAAMLPTRRRRFRRFDQVTVPGFRPAGSDTGHNLAGVTAAAKTNGQAVPGRNPRGMTDRESTPLDVCSTPCSSSPGSGESAVLEPAMERVGTIDRPARTREIW